MRLRASRFMSEATKLKLFNASRYLDEIVSQSTTFANSAT